MPLAGDVPAISGFTLRFFRRLVRRYFRKHFRAVLAQQAEQLRLAELDRSRARLADLTPEQHAAVEAQPPSLTSNFLHAPITAMRSNCARSKGR